MPIQRARVSVDLVYEADKPLSGALLTRITNRTASFIRIGAVEGLEDRIRVLFDDQYRWQHTHHHDARHARCRPDLEASADGLGPIE